MAGGVAKNIGVVRALEKVMDTDIKIPFESQVVSALGAALFAFEKVS
jgi:activator of 2-hydroxyglutaryl-CoA dehydratase